MTYLIHFFCRTDVPSTEEDWNGYLKQINSKSSEGDFTVKVQAASNVPLQNVQMEGASGCKVRWLLSNTDGAPNFAMRQFELQPGGFTPHHYHPYEHEIYVLEGEGIVIDGDTPRPLRTGDGA